jgi:tripartite-type tricarboxylate transporter receptor subunit TctC
MAVPPPSGDRMRILAVLCLCLAALAARAQPVVHIVVPFAAGGVQDILARTVAPDLGALIGRNVIVENRTGASGTIGNAYVAKAAPDGNTLLLAAASHTITGHVYPKLPYDPLNDFTAVAHIGTVDYVLMASSTLPVKNVAELIAYAKANPGKLNYATAGAGSATHLSMAYFANLAGMDVVHIPLKGTNEAINEVLSGRSHLVVASTIGALGFVKDARVRMLGVTGATRSKFVPELPTLAEAGVKGYVFDSWLGLLGPAGIPRPVLEQLNGAMAKALQTASMQERLDKQGIIPKALTPEAFAALLRENSERMATVVKVAGAKLD